MVQPIHRKQTLRTDSRPEPTITNPWVDPTHGKLWLRRCLLHWTGYDVSTASPLVCRCHFFLVHFFSQLSSSTVALLSADRAVVLWRTVPTARLFGRRRMAVVWAIIVTVLGAANLHFFWTAEHVSVSADANNDIPDGDWQVMSKPEASTVNSNYSNMHESTADILSLSTMSQAFPFPNLFPFPEKAETVPVTSKLSTATIYPTVTKNDSAHSRPQWADAGDDVHYCLIARRYIRFYLGVWYWIDLTLWSIAPFVTIIVSNVSIVIRLTLFDDLKLGAAAHRTRCRHAFRSTGSTTQPPVYVFNN